MKFLVNEREIDSPRVFEDSYYRDGIFERLLIQCKDPQNSPLSIFTFGINSAHGKEFIFIKDQKNIRIVNTDSLEVAMDMVIKSFQSSNCIFSSNDILAFMEDILSIYNHNRKIVRSYEFKKPDDK